MGVHVSYLARDVRTSQVRVLVKIVQKQLFALLSSNIVGVVAGEKNQYLLRSDL